MAQRKAEVNRKSKETEIRATLTIEGKGKSKIKTQIGILDHMLELFAFHGFFDLIIDVKKADLEIDIHHTNEDVGIVLGKLFKEALADKEGIRRFGSGFAPMESTLGHCVIDISGRGYLHFQMGDSKKVTVADKEGYRLTYLHHFLESFAHGLGATINVQVSGVSEDLHTNLEAVFKSLGLALDQATQLEPRRKGMIPSTKGIID